MPQALKLYSPTKNPSLKSHVFPQQIQPDYRERVEGDVWPTEKKEDPSVYNTCSWLLPYMHHDHPHFQCKKAFLDRSLAVATAECLSLAFHSGALQDLAL